MWIQLALQLLAAIPSLITEAEAAFSSKPGLGDKKKQFVMDAAKAALGIVQTTGKVNMDESHVSVILSAVSSITDATVASLNAANVFKK